MEDSHCLVALVELVVLVELVEDLVELVNAIVLDFVVLVLPHEALLLDQEFAGCARLRCDLCLRGHVVPQVLELHAVVEDVVPRHLVHLGVDALSLPLHVDVDVAVARGSRCRIGD